MQPVVDREALPGEVEATLVRVEREQDHDEDRDEQVEQRERRPQPEQLVADRVPAARARKGATRARGERRCGGGRRLGDRAHTAASVRLRVPSTFAYANTA